MWYFITDATAITVMPLKCRKNAYLCIYLFIYLLFCFHCLRLNFFSGLVLHLSHTQRARRRMLGGRWSKQHCRVILGETWSKSRSGILRLDTQSRVIHSQWKDIQGFSGQHYHIIKAFHHFLYISPSACSTIQGETIHLVWDSVHNLWMFTDSRFSNNFQTWTWIKFHFVKHGYLTDGETSSHLENFEKSSKELLHRAINPDIFGLDALT